MSVRDVVQAAAGVGGGAGEYIEDVFSTYLYTGNSSTQTITNGIDLDGEGGLVWIKRRNGVGDNTITDTIRGPGKELYTNQTWEQQNYTGTYGVSAFNSTGFSLIGNNAPTNGTNQTYASWTFRKAPKFFDVVTYTGTGSATTIPHNLGSVPGMIIVKRTDSTANWAVYHRSLTSANYSLLLNLTGAQDETGYFANTTPTDTVFSISSNSVVNASGGTYVAYLFAHNAGGFGDDGQQNVISCGSFTTDGSGNATVNLGFEPQWALIKKTTAAQNWVLCDTMRGWNMTTNADKYLAADTSSAESNQSQGNPTATGFNIDSTSNFGSSSTFIYIAIRRPMKTPESGTEVFNAVANTGTSTAKTIAGVGFAPDWVIAAEKPRTLSPYNNGWDRLRGANKSLITNETGGENSTTDTLVGFDVMDGFRVGADTAQGWINFSNGGFPNRQYINWCFKRAPGFMDVVAYTGTGVAHTEAHNLGVVPEMIIIKNRNNSQVWGVYNSNSGNSGRLILNATDSLYSPVQDWNSTSPTDSVFSLGGEYRVNGPSYTYVAYLFATLAGVSKVGSYTGTGADINVDCGFSAGARFILIKRTDSTGDWYVWDSARGIVSGNDPYLLLNSTAAEVTSTDYIDPLSSGFTVTSSAPAALNASGGTYIFLAIA